MMLPFTGTALIGAAVALFSIRAGQPPEIGTAIAQGAMLTVWIGGGAIIAAAVSTLVAIMIGGTAFMLSLAMTLSVATTPGRTESTNPTNWFEINAGTIYTASAIGICLSIATILMVIMAAENDQRETRNESGKKIETTVTVIAVSAAVLITEGSINGAPRAWELCILVMMVMPISGAAMAAIAARMTRRTSGGYIQQGTSARHHNTTIIAQIVDAGLEFQRCENAAQNARLRSTWRMWMHEDGPRVLAQAQAQHNRKNHPASGIHPWWATPGGHATMVATDTLAIAQHIAKRWKEHAQREQIEFKPGDYEKNRDMAQTIVNRAPALGEDWDKRCAQSLRARKEALERDTIIGVLVTIGAAATTMHNEFAMWTQPGAGIIACVAMGLSVARGHCALIARATLRATQ